MEKKLITENGYCKKVVVEYSVIEWMIVDDALKQFAKRQANHPVDRHKAETMASVKMNVLG